MLEELQIAHGIDLGYSPGSFSSIQCAVGQLSNHSDLSFLITKMEVKRW